MVFQQYSLFPNMSVHGNVAYGLKLKTAQSGGQPEGRAYAGHRGLSEKIDQYPAQLSGGQQQRVALARAMVTAPVVPCWTSRSAPLTRCCANLQVEIRSIQQRLGITTIFVTHDQTEAMVMSDTIHLFHDGRIEQSGTPEEIYTRPATKFAATFIGNYNLPGAADFNRAFGANIKKDDVAIRPEIVQLSKQPIRREQGLLVAEGVIACRISHGNLMRFGVDFDGLSLNADVVVLEHVMDMGEGDKVYAAIKEDLVIGL